MEKFEISGDWWVPESPDYKISGSLKFNAAEDTILELNGSFYKFPNVPNPYETIILGIDKTGIRFTLKHCRLLSVSRDLYNDKLFESKYAVNLIYKNFHFHKTEDIKFNKMSIEINHLYEWAGISGFNDLPNYFKGSGEINIKYINPKASELFSFNGFSLMIITNNSLTIPFVQNELQLKEKTYLVIENNEATTFYEFHKIINIFTHFLNFVTLKPNYELSILAFSMPYSNLREDGIEVPTPPVEIFFKKPFIKDSKKLDIYEILFRYNDDKDKIRNVLLEWFKNYQNYRQIFILFSSSLYNENTYNEHQFLSLVQCLEIFHRIKYEQTKTATKELPDSEFELRKKQILTSVTTLWKDWIKRKLTNYSTLRERLFDIINESEYILKDFFDIDKFINRTVKTRNYITHYSSEINEMVLENSEMAIYTEKLKLILTVSILSELGFNHIEIKQIISNHVHYNNLKNFTID
ncbi:MAG: HEPN domain-containing protein [Ignavibacteria bacterium]